MGCGLSGCRCVSPTTSPLGKRWLVVGIRIPTTCLLVEDVDTGSKGPLTLLGCVVYVRVDE
jgi:hypothetical protein